MTRQNLKTFFEKGSVLKDGAMGTEILHRGIETPIPLWSAYALLEHPEVVQQIHLDYIKAGARIITTNTFRTTARMLQRAGYPTGKAREITLLACDLARNAIKQAGLEEKVLIGGSVAPLEDCYSPELTPPDAELQSEHAQYVKDLTDGGVDFIFIETMITIRETLAACKAAKENDIPIAVCFCCDDKGLLLGGESIADAVHAVTPYEPLFLGINCMQPGAILKSLPYLKKSTQLPICVYAQGDGKPEENLGWQFQNDTEESMYFNFAKNALEQHVNIIGGCCGTTPSDIKKVHELLGNK
jgi:homocysteine S-methyltransferase